MPRKFVYAPGLPGYGTKGVDGSAGLLGLATYFSAYDGNSDTVTIKSKIIANKELFSTDSLLPGYPARIYQTGDIFIDKNARVFQIDFAESNLYADTGTFLNTSGFFTSGPVQSSSPGFERYSNTYDTEKVLIDMNYSNGVLENYATYPQNIYKNAPEFFGRIDFVGSDVVVDLNGYYPFQVWTIGNSNNSYSIALSREENNNIWHFGNLDNTDTVRDVSLSLDFKDINIPGNLSVDGSIIGNFTGTITANNLYLPGWLRTGGDASFGSDIYVTENLFGNTINSIGDISIGNNLYIEGNEINFTGTGTNYINSGTGILYIQTEEESTGSPTANLFLRTGSATGTLGGNAGDLFISGGSGADDNNGTPGAGGDINLDSGAGGDRTGGSAGAGGAGGDFDFETGDGGTGYLTGSGGTAGDMDFTIGTGGDGGATGDGGRGGFFHLNFLGNDAKGGQGDSGGDGGNIALYSGIGGTGLTTAGGAGGDFNLRGGQGGSASGSAATPGIGGETQINSGAGGDYDHASGTPDGGLGGNLLIIAGSGGESGSSSASSFGGDGGRIQIEGGTGGIQTSSSLRGGDGGDVSIGGGAGETLGGDVNIGGGVAFDGGNVVITGGKGSNSDGDVTLDINSSGTLYFKGVTTGVSTTSRFSLQIDGSEVVTAAASGTSDIRLKNIDSYITNVISKLIQLNGVNFHWNDVAKQITFADTSIAEYGLIAQEVAPLFPDLVRGFERDGSTWLTIEYDKFVPIIIEGIKEQQSIIETQESEINSLSSDVSTLTNLLLDLTNRVQDLENA